MKLNFKIIVFLGIIIPFMTVAQEFTLEKTPEQEELAEEAKYLNFQKYFFEALNQKAREDYNKALESLDICKGIYPDDKGLNFEYAKNYLKLADFDNAIFFDEKALENDSENIYILEHLKQVYTKQRDFKNAIKIQHKLMVIKPAKENGLILLYIQNREREKAKTAFLKLEKMCLLDLRERYFRRVLFPKKKTNFVKEPATTSKKDNSFKSFIAVLKQNETDNKYDMLLKNSEEALSFFPAQPKLYIFNAKALNRIAKYKKAITVLEQGLDFIVDDNTLLKKYYEQLKIAYLGLGQPTKATKYQNKALGLK